MSSSFTFFFATLLLIAAASTAGVAPAQADGGERFLASSTDPATTDAMKQAGAVGRRVDVAADGERRLFAFAAL